MEDLKNLVLTPFDGMLSLEQIAHQTLLLDDIQVRNGHFPSDNVLMVFNGGAVSPQHLDRLSTTVPGTNQLQGVCGEDRGVSEPDDAGRHHPRRRGHQEGEVG